MDSVDWALLSGLFAYTCFTLGVLAGKKSGRRSGYDAGYKDCLKYTTLNQESNPKL